MSDRRQLQRRIEELREQVARLSRSVSYGCLTRPGLDEVMTTLKLADLSCVYWDLDGLTQLNGKLGKEEVNRRVTHVLQNYRQSDCITGQVFSGDEFAAFPPAPEASALAERLLKGLHTWGISATFVVILPKVGETYTELLSRADKLCAMHKSLNERGKIHVH